MRELGTLASANASVSRPAFFVVIHDATNMAPSAVLCENLLLEEMGGIAWFNTIPFQVDAIISNLKVKGTRPQSLGAGLIRREASFSVLSNNNTSPYINGVLSAAIWSGGASTDSVIFSIWGTDVGSIVDSNTKDITNGVCFGYFRLDSSTSWDEQSRTCNFNLIDVTISDDRIIAASTNPGVSTLLSFNSDYNAKVIPTVYGAVQRVKMLRGYPDFSLADGQNPNTAFSGTIGVSYGPSDTGMVLEYPSYESSILRQLISIGAVNVRIRMEDDEVMVGVISYNSGSNSVILYPVARSQPYYSGKAYSNFSIETTESVFGGTTRPADYETKYPFYKAKFSYGYNPQELHLKDAMTSPYGPILWDKAQMSKTGFGYIKLSASFAGSDIGDKVTYAKLADTCTVVTTEGAKTNLAKLFIETDIAKGAYNTTTRYSYEPPTNESKHFTQVAIGGLTLAGITPASDLTAVEYINFNVGTVASPLKYYSKLRNTNPTDKVEPYDTIELYYRDPTLGNGSGTGGVSKWWLLQHGGAVSYNHYINAGYTYIDSTSNFYGVGENGLVKIPPAFILGVDPIVSEYGYTTLVRIRLSTPPTGMGIGLTTNDVYVDCSYQPGWGWDRHKIIFELLSKSRLAPFISESNLNPNNYTGAPDTNLQIGFVCSGETYSEMIDKIFFQIGEALRWNNRNGFDWFSTLVTGLNGGGTWIGEVVNADDLYDNTAALQLTKFKSVTNAPYKESLPYYLEVSYGGWMDPFYVSVENKDPIGQDEVFLQYKFDCIQTPTAAQICVDYFKALGSASGIYTSGRHINIVGGIQQLCKYEPLDCFLVNNYPSMTDDASLSPIMHRSSGTIQYDLDSYNYVLQGVCVADTVEYNLSIDDVSVVINGIVSQQTVDARGIKLNELPATLGTQKKNSGISTDTTSTTPSTVPSSGDVVGFPWDVTIGNIRSQGTIVSGAAMVKLSHSCGSQVRMYINSSGVASLLVTNCSGQGQMVTPTGIVPVTASGDDPPVETGPALTPINIEACVDGVTKTLTLYGFVNP